MRIRLSSPATSTTLAPTTNIHPSGLSRVRLLQKRIGRGTSAISLLRVRCQSRAHTAELEKLTKPSTWSNGNSILAGRFPHVQKLIHVSRILSHGCTSKPVQSRRGALSMPTAYQGHGVALVISCA